ncbi:hypothetical protein L207DRAFT_177114 [Hyaloscypha variabilis F]|jgi:hypothetical protein|uniref:Uncharacterized protein n=1 Tax=Hyaloscypha variabilis (strain UAMH 11265 / GT02V1 / F) TaxID=1149755 RepID=A0A2J6R2D5_HYAVF|nr:hypothetical protein L207DRAFT_177114 [Hyaloscypha variabilis F]
MIKERRGAREHFGTFSRKKQPSLSSMSLSSNPILASVRPRLSRPRPTHASPDHRIPHCRTYVGSCFAFLSPSSTLAYSEPDEEMWDSSSHSVTSLRSFRFVSFCQSVLDRVLRNFETSSTNARRISMKFRPIASLLPNKIPNSHSFRFPDRRLYPLH